MTRDKIEYKIFMGSHPAEEEEEEEEEEEGEEEEKEV
jgi:hypothetical protein